MSARSGKWEAEFGDDDPSGERPLSYSNSGFPSRAAKLAMVCAFAAAVLAAPLWAPFLMRHMPYFRVRRVEIVGARYVAPSDILSRLHVDTMASIWDPTKPLAERVAGLPDIATAVVGRKFPGTLVVQVTERTPVALVPGSGGFLVFDERGTSLRVDPSRVALDVPILSQRDTAVLRLLGTMRTKMPTLYARLSEVRRVGRDELVFQLKNWPVRVKRDVTLERLADIDPIEADLVRRHVRVAEIDLRYRDQVIARIQ
jgi:cell division septal protein FtsQ